MMNNFLANYFDDACFFSQWKEYLIFDCLEIMQDYVG